jgi:hypothetical protein
MGHPVIYTNSFIVFWGLSLAISLAAGGLLSFAVVATILLMLIHHEHAHAKKCVEYNVPIHSITFEAWGAMVDARLPNTHEGIEIYKAGVVNSGCYAISFVALLVIVREFAYSNGWNIADSLPNGLLYWMQFLNSISLAAVVLVVTNILPIWWYSKKHGLVTFDGCAVFLRREARDELWNDGRVIASEY